MWSGAACGTKPYTAVACLKQAEAGNLDLDKPIKEYLDPWFAKQTPPIPPLRILWQGHADIERVTTRMLLSMRAGLQDYDDNSEIWRTIANPLQDRTPLDYILDTGKDFLWEPGTHGKYSGTGYVLAGLVLSAISGAKTWDGLDQKALLVNGQCKANADSGNVACANVTELFSHGSIFMMNGSCASHPNVVHSYMYTPPQWYDLQYGCDPGGDVRCAEAGTVHDKRAGPFTESVADYSNYTDLSCYSCLNGYTMGNGGLAPADMAAFWWNLGSGRILNQSSHDQFADFKPFYGPTGYGFPPYGLGVMSDEYRIPLKSGESCGQYAADSEEYNRNKQTLGHTRTTLCDPDTSMAVIGGWTHGGRDWGSQVPVAGYFPGLGASIATDFQLLMVKIGGIFACSGLYVVCVVVGRFGGFGEL